jgi:glycosyltransferase involved in cell wall biosynthesis
VKVLQVMAGARVGGAEAFFERLVAALARAGLEQRAVIRRHEDRAARLSDAGISVVEAAFRRRLDLATRRTLAREIASFRPDLVLSWMGRAAGLVPSGLAPHVGRLGGYYDLKAYRGCDHLIANTRDILADLVARGWPAERVHYLPNFVTAARQPAQPRAALETPQDVPLLLALGRLHANKAFDVLLGALVKVPAAWLWLAGEGPEERRLRKLARDLGLAGRVRFLGWRTDVAALLAACDVLVCPSRHEPLGNVVLEGWAQERPVVAAAAKGPAALITEGETGLLVPPDDADALAAALAQILHDRVLAARLAAMGRAAYEAEFTERAVVARYVALFEALTGACRSSEGRTGRWPKPTT